MSTATFALASAVALVAASTPAPTIFGQTDAPTILGVTEAPTVFDGTTNAPTIFGETNAPTIDASLAPTVDDSTSAPTVTAEPTSNDEGVGAGKGGDFLGLSGEKWAYTGPLLAALVLCGALVAYYLYRKLSASAGPKAEEYDDASPLPYGTLADGFTTETAGAGDNANDTNADPEAPSSPLVGSHRSNSSRGSRSSGTSKKIALGDVITDTEIAITSK